MGVNLKLKARIVETHGTQADFAQIIGEDETLISRIIRGRRQLNPAKQKAWAKALDCKSEDIFEEVRA